jgi:hypothetical protein
MLFLINLFKQRIFKLFFLLAPFSLLSLNYQPWLGNVYEFDFLSTYKYGWFKQVDSSTTKLNSTYNAHLLRFDLEFTSTPRAEYTLELELCDTTRQQFSFRSIAVQAKKLFLDDIVGDVVSLTSSFSLRYISPRSKKDISSPYGSDVDFEAHVAIGKEIDSNSYWRFRFWADAGVGIANQGSPWLKGKASFEGNFDDRHRWAVLAKVKHGYGKNTKIVINNFKGYSRYRERFVDLCFCYGFRLGVWGTFKAEYDRRLLAKVCPENVNTFVFSYNLPFSF